MNQEEIFYNTGIIPVIKIDKAEKAVPLAEALLKAGIPIAEITFRSDAAEKGISLLKKNVNGILIGAGTVLTQDQLERAIGAGADFIVTPGYNPDIVEKALYLNKVIYPGVNSPSQVEIALSKGLKILKFFPAEVSGGIAMMKALQPVYNVKFIPTGGINSGNIIKYLECKNVIACGGTWMVSPELIENENYDEIYKLSKEAVDVISQLRSSNKK
ncbi:MAG: bifunctional 4-hydroxy-2-oxoglutarate aldolase/2-dehydro-3-deoxy-phosphogluconate aldolase [Spirochaetaceae bacterium]|nr:bifunctional 4-hydroxy-2-oxoglutarate aldolase/2-dehydro-3-deoxy-phosphogluconate aldolase [Spirochaetaceae bacterium]